MEGVGDNEVTQRYGPSVRVVSNFINCHCIHCTTDNYYS